MFTPWNVLYYSLHVVIYNTRVSHSHPTTHKLLVNIHRQKLKDPIYFLLRHGTTKVTVSSQNNKQTTHPAPTPTAGAVSPSHPRSNWRDTPPPTVLTRLVLLNRVSLSLLTLGHGQVVALSISGIITQLSRQTRYTWISILKLHVQQDRHSLLRLRVNK